MPVVSSVEVTSISDANYLYNDIDYDAYEVNMAWDYESDLGYEKEGIITLIKEDNKLYIVEKK